ncbi:beta-lactamase superfamily domain-containing protein [Lipomyces oligophaga]|uniref:beta-lactamase superfamily domain-containing protein n=1 Tax=Lipomyces oligophaga TaxID=45792 RepID=UPI0034CD4C8E
MMRSKTACLVVTVVAVYTICFGYIAGGRHYAIIKRRTKARRAREKGDVEALQDATPQIQYGVLVIAGRFANPFPEYRDQGVLDFIIWNFVKLLRFTPRGGVPRDRSVLRSMLPSFRPDYEVLFEQPNTSSDGRAKTTDSESLLGHASPAGLSSSITSAMYSSSETGSSTNVVLDSLEHSWTAIPGNQVDNTSSNPQLSKLPSSIEVQSLPSSDAGSDRHSEPNSPISRPSGLLHHGPEIPSVSERLTVTWIGQSCMLVQCCGINFLTDPIFGESLINSYIGPQRLSPSPCQIEDLPTIDFVFISHNHPDHFEEAALKKIGNKATWVVGVGLRPYFSRRGVFKVIEMKWWEKIPVPGHEKDGWEIACTPAMHWAGRGIFDANKSLWCSFMILHHSRPVVFHAGDTGFSPELFDGIAKVYGPGCELALVPCGAYEPRPHLRPLHCNPEEAIQIMVTIGARRLIGVHWGTFVLSDEHFLEPKQRLEKEATHMGLSDAVWAADFGRTVIIPYHPELDAVEVDDEPALRLPDSRVSSIGPMIHVEGRDTIVW